jgi:hypothetical protein
LQLFACPWVKAHTRAQLPPALEQKGVAHVSAT